MTPLIATTLVVLGEVGLAALIITVIRDEFVAFAIWVICNCAVGIVLSIFGAFEAGMH